MNDEKKEGNKDNNQNTYQPFQIGDLVRHHYDGFQVALVIGSRPVYIDKDKGDKCIGYDLYIFCSKAAGYEKRIINYADWSLRLIEDPEKLFAFKD